MPSQLQAGEKVNTWHTWHSNHFCLTWAKQDVRVMRQTQHNLGQNCVIWMTERSCEYIEFGAVARGTLGADLRGPHESWLASPRRLRRGERERRLLYRGCSSRLRDASNREMSSPVFPFFYSAPPPHLCSLTPRRLLSLTPPLALTQQKRNINSTRVPRAHLAAPLLHNIVPRPVPASAPRP